MVSQFPFHFKFKWTLCMCLLQILRLVGVVWKAAHLIFMFPSKIIYFGHDSGPLVFNEVTALGVVAYTMLASCTEPVHSPLLYLKRNLLHTNTRLSSSFVTAFECHWPCTRSSTWHIERLNTRLECHMLVLTCPLCWNSLQVYLPGYGPVVLWYLVYVCTVLFLCHWVHTW